MAKVLVTGAAGFIGSAITRQLVADGHTTIGVDNLIGGSRENLEGVRDDFEFRQLDVRERATLRELCRGVDVIFHQAALPSVPKSVADPETTHHHNLNATLSVLLAARDAGVRRVVYAASSSAYGESDALPLAESECPQPRSPYAVQKLAGEHYMQCFGLLYGMETVCLRYFNVFGPRQDASSPYSGVLARFITLMLERTTPTIYGDGLQGRDFIYIQDIVQANLLAGFSRRDGTMSGLYNVARGELHTLLETYEILARIMGFEGQPRFEPAREGDIRFSQADISRARHELGFDPMVTFDDGLALTVDWYMAKAKAISQLR